MWMRMDGTDLDGAVLEVLRVRPPVPLHLASAEARVGLGAGVPALHCCGPPKERSVCGVAGPCHSLLTLRWWCWLFWGRAAGSQVVQGWHFLRAATGAAAL